MAFDPTNPTLHPRVGTSVAITVQGATGPDDPVILATLVQLYPDRENLTVKSARLQERGGTRWSCVIEWDNPSYAGGKK